MFGNFYADGPIAKTKGQSTATNFYKWQVARGKSAKKKLFEYFILKIDIKWSAVAICVVRTSMHFNQLQQQWSLYTQSVCFQTRYQYWWITFLNPLKLDNNDVDFIAENMFSGPQALCNGV